MSISQSGPLSLDPTINLIISLLSRLNPVEKTLVKKYLDKEKPWESRFANTLSYFRTKTSVFGDKELISDVLEAINEVRREKKSSS